MGLHDKGFDDATQLKLQLFRGYIREWIPVFLTEYKRKLRNFSRVNIFDFFAGPGRDVKGNPGSPVIIVEELKAYCAENDGIKASGIDIRMFFNDVNVEHIKELKNEIAKVSCPRGCCATEFSSQTFSECLSSHLPNIHDDCTANLVIMDQFGVKQVTPEVVAELARCPTTDILFFISTSFIRRFLEMPGIGSNFELNIDEIRAVEYLNVHRFICNHFRTTLSSEEYHLAPFSIKKGRNIYGVIFGSRSLLGLDKFLDVCWTADKVTGEANFNIDGDYAWGEENLLFPKVQEPRKFDEFRSRVLEFVKANHPDNREMYRYCLINGFHPKIAKGILLEIQKVGDLRITDKRTGGKARSTYLTWDGYQESARAVYEPGKVP